jgi:anaerobic ribonucleoside-triphosphate reductase
MTEKDLYWLKSLKICDDRDVLDCDSSARTITFKNGAVRQVTEVWQRVMGYHRPTVAWNIGKQQEHRDRLYFEQPPVS